MDVHHAWFDPRPGVGDLARAARPGAYPGHLGNEGLIAGWRLTRRTLGLGPPGLGEWPVTIDVRDLGRLEAAFQRVAARREPVEGLHHAVNSVARNTVFALYRDFPDPVRRTGEERF